MDPGDRLEALALAAALKDEPRTGWLLRGVEDPESVAAHSWGVALLTLVYGPDADVDVGHALRLAVVHDVAEAVTGDVATRAEEGAQRVAPDEKHRRERAAMDALAGPLGDPIREAWAEYEARETPAARFVKDMDLVDQCLQAWVYERAGRYAPGEADAFERYDALDEFFATAEPRVRTPTGEALLTALRERYERAKRERREGDAGG
jgi:putative hydrolase of HD superfamily